MTLIAIIVCLMLEMFWQRLSDYRNYSWFRSYLEMLEQRLGQLAWWQGPAGVLVVIAGVVVPVMVVHALFDDMWLGVLELLFGIAVLAACLRFQSLDRMVDDYEEAVASDDRAAMGKAAMAVSGHPHDPAAASGRYVREMMQGVLVSSNERLFAVLFWFVLLGPAGAVLYRAVQSLHGMQLQTQATEEPQDEMGFAISTLRLLQILDWLPSRLLALTYGLSGSFEDALQEWREYSEQTPLSSLQLGNEALAHAGAGALCVSRYEKGDDEEMVELEPELVRSARALVLRALVTWCIVLALTTLSGLLA